MFNQLRPATLRGLIRWCWRGDICDQCDNLGGSTSTILLLQNNNRAAVIACWLLILTYLDIPSIQHQTKHFSFESECTELGYKICSTRLSIRRSLSTVQFVRMLREMMWINFGTIMSFFPDLCSFLLMHFVMLSCSQYLHIWEVQRVSSSHWIVLQFH